MQGVKGLFPPAEYPRLIIGLGEPDDAAVYKLDEERAIIQTLDFFPPVVDDPYLYGAVAAANAMSDVYAMGGEVLFALNIAAFPRWLEDQVIADIFRGGADKLREAGAALAGGHTMDDEEPKYGMAVTGIVHPARLLRKAGARPGDALILTKPLGTGLITTALKGGVAAPAHVEAALASMLCLNRSAAQAAVEAGLTCGTDVTGFSLLGHAWEVAGASGLAIHIWLDELPILEGTRAYAEEWLFPGGASNNKGFYAPHVRFAEYISDEEQMMLFTPETSGGLLLAVPAAKRDAFDAACRARGQAYWHIGEAAEGSGIQVY